MLCAYLSLQLLTHAGTSCQILEIRVDIAHIESVGKASRLRFIRICAGCDAMMTFGQNHQTGGKIFSNARDRCNAPTQSSLLWGLSDTFFWFVIACFVFCYFYGFREYSFEPMELFNCEECERGRRISRAAREGGRTSTLNSENYDTDVEEEHRVKRISFIQSQFIVIFFSFSTNWRNCGCCLSCCCCCCRTPTGC